MGNSIDALARQIESVVQQTVEPSPGQGAGAAEQPESLVEEPGTGSPDGERDDPAATQASGAALDDLGQLAAGLSRAFDAVEPEPRSTSVRVAAPVAQLRAVSPAEPAPAAPAPAEDDLDGVSPQSIVDALRQGERSESERLFGRLSGLTEAEVNRMLYRSDGEMLAAACRAIEMEQLQFVSLYIMTRKASSTTESVDVVDLKQTLEVFNELSGDQARNLLIAWRQETGS